MALCWLCNCFFANHGTAHFFPTHSRVSIIYVPRLHVLRCGFAFKLRNKHWSTSAQRVSVHWHCSEEQMWTPLTSLWFLINLSKLQMGGKKISVRWVQVLIKLCTASLSNLQLRSIPGVVRSRVELLPLTHHPDPFLWWKELLHSSLMMIQYTINIHFKASTSSFALPTLTADNIRKARLAWLADLLCVHPVSCPSEWSLNCFLTLIGKQQQHGLDVHWWGRSYFLFLQLVCGLCVFYYDFINSMPYIVCCFIFMRSHTVLNKLHGTIWVWWQLCTGNVNKQWLVGWVDCHQVYFKVLYYCTLKSQHCVQSHFCGSLLQCGKATPMEIHVSELIRVTVLRTNCCVADYSPSLTKAAS